MTMLNDDTQGVRVLFRCWAAPSLALALLLGACGGADPEEAGQSSALSASTAFSASRLSSFQLICKPSGPRAFLVRLSTALQHAGTGARLLSTAPEGEGTDPGSAEPTNGDQLGTLVDHLEHVASKDTMIENETCFDFKTPPEIGSIFYVRGTQGGASLRYSPESKVLAWCLSYDDSTLSVAPGDTFSVDVYTSSSTQVCSPVSTK